MDIQPLISWFFEYISFVHWGVEGGTLFDMLKYLTNSEDLVWYKTENFQGNAWNVDRSTTVGVCIACTQTCAIIHTKHVCIFALLQIRPENLLYVVQSKSDAGIRYLKDLSVKILNQLYKHIPILSFWCLTFVAGCKSFMYSIDVLISFKWRHALQKIVVTQLRRKSFKYTGKLFWWYDRNQPCTHWLIKF